LPMPPDEGVWLNDGQDLSPREESGKQHQRQPGSILGSLRFGLALIEPTVCGETGSRRPAQTSGAS
jgi:hypothetical protein